MQRIDAPEILDSPDCPVDEVAPALKTLDRINRWFGGVATTQRMIDRVSAATGMKNLSLLEVAAGSGRVPKIVAQNLSHQGIKLEFTLLDRLHSHIAIDDCAAERGRRQNLASGSVAADARALPFSDESFDLVSCNLFAHHLSPTELILFFKEALRVCRVALLINDLIRHPVHLALVYASYPIMGSRVAWLDGLASVRRAYTPSEMRDVLAMADLRARLEIIRNYLFRMGVMVWKQKAG